MPLSPHAAAPVALGVLAVGLFAASPALAGSDLVRATGPLTVYDPALAGATARLQVEYDTLGDTHLRLSVAGAQPSTYYVVRAHVGGCPSVADELDDVFQASPNPDAEESPEDPLFRNPVNEVWLDVETGPTGAGVRRARQPWQFHPTWRAGSVVLHALLPMERESDPVVGRALACLEVPF
jgi:hypothetical protein